MRWFSIVRVAYVMFLVQIAVATPAGAHAVGGVTATNVRSTLTAVRPATPGLHVAVVDLGQRIRLHNDTREPVTVFGYQREPYLRITATGVFVNSRSPAAFLNRSLTPTRSVPDRYNATAPPEWRRLSVGHETSWHDHRAHWMGSSEPAGQRRRDGSRLLGTWTIPMLAGATQTAAVGTTAWVPGPPVLPSLLVALALALVVIFLGIGRGWRAWLIAGLVVVMVSEVIHVVGLFGATTQSAGSVIGASVWSFVALAIGCGALAALLIRRDVWRTVPLVLAAGVALTAAGGLGDLESLHRSQLASTLPPPLLRALIVMSLGVGVGLIVVALTHLPPRHRRNAAM